uniref:VPS9 domain-containing protein n=1 Tax=Pyrodinium bahamense TaxID=73915 RepID=A0A7S0B3X7_9DINO
MHRLRSPAQMLGELAQAFRGITEAACIRAQVHAAGSGEHGDAFGADASLPLFILVVLHANPPMFNSVLTYCERFIPPMQKLTEQGYALTQAHAAASFAESVRPADLNGLQPGEWERNMGTAGMSSVI